MYRRAPEKTSRPETGAKPGKRSGATGRCYISTPGFKRAATDDPRSGGAISSPAEAHLLYEPGTGNENKGHRAGVGYFAQYRKECARHLSEGHPGIPGKQRLSAGRPALPFFKK